MSDFSINEMQEMQKELQEKYKDKWEAICPENGKNKLLWMIGEIGEVIDIVKKHGGEKASTDTDLRLDLVEEMADILEVLYAICEARGYSIEELMQVKETKRDERGGFKDRVYWVGNMEQKEID